ncbi:hypothetical protein I6N96_09515 [Enterococcus sp. BWM-S5]|uniref:Uncharacterized protein n=1 Tax=Enterococcus larvae TaxID=2794352 RepID=A0ABS4CK18_9ENTE|nr:hypothetical protein [Enterococcus larvae]MBP1046523.1 hypothetical protein [Enterococcus larvae]
MSVLDWSFVILLSAALLFFLLGILFFFSFLLASRKFKPVKKKRPPKNKKKRRQFLQLRKQLDKKRRSRRLWSILFLLIAAMSLGGGFYSRYYQQNNLGGDDSEALVQSYYLLEEAVLQINNVQAGENPQKSIKNLQEVTSRLASYGARKAAMSLSTDGQTLLNRHFTMLRELGVNLNGQTVESLQNQGTSEGYLEDIEKVRESQSKVFKRFNVNEGALKKKQ